MITTILTHLRNLYHARANAARLAELERQLGSLSARVDIVRRGREHDTRRACLLEGRNRKLAAKVDDLTTQLEATRAQLAAARDLIDRRTVSLRIAEEKWADEAQRVIDLEGEAALWLSRQVRAVGVLQNN